MHNYLRKRSNDLKTTILVLNSNLATLANCLLNSNSSHINRTETWCESILNQIWAVSSTNLPKSQN